jgi:glutamyl-tRNA synthetase
VKGNLADRGDIAAWWATFRYGAKPELAEEDRDFVAQALALLPAMPFTPITWHDWTEAVKAATGRKGKGLYMPLRLALTGKERGPEMADVMPLLQKRPAL